MPKEIVSKPLLGSISMFNRGWTQIYRLTFSKMKDFQTLLGKRRNTSSKTHTFRTAPLYIQHAFIKVNNIVKAKERLSNNYTLYASYYDYSFNHVD